MTRAVNSPAAVPAVVTEIGRHAAIRALNLAHGECRILDLREGDVVENLKIQMTAAGKRHPELPRLICGLGLKVEPQARGRADSAVARIVCDYAVQYDFADRAFFDRITDRDIEMFSAYNTSLNAWPHAREFVQSMAARMMLPPLILPLFRPAETIPVERWRMGAET
jgi:hypothetical protein